MSGKTKNIMLTSLAQSSDELEILLYTLIIFVLLWMLTNRIAHRYRDALRTSLTATAPRPFKTDQPWRKPLNPYIKNLKEEIERKETKILDAHIDTLIHSDSYPGKDQRHLIDHMWFFYASKLGDRREVSTTEREEYAELCKKLDRIWSGDVGLERGEVMRRIKVLKHQTPQSVQIVELEHDLADLDELMKKLKHPYESTFQNSRDKRTYNARSKLIDIFEGPAREDIEVRRMYNEAIAEIHNDPSFTAAQKKDMVANLDSRLKQYIDKNVPKQQQNPFSYYRKDA